jgi:hypothetical protein
MSTGTTIKCSHESCVKVANKSDLESKTLPRVILLMTIHKAVSKSSQISSVVHNRWQHRVALAAIVIFNLDKAVCQKTLLC